VVTGVASNHDLRNMKSKWCVFGVDSRFEERIHSIHSDHIPLSQSRSIL
jgi:hypothetical protein